MFKRSEHEPRTEGRAVLPVEVVIFPPLPKKAVSGNGDANASLSVLPKGAKLEGTLRTANNVRIDGEFSGSIVSGGDAVFAPGSRVEADVQAHNVIVGGHHRGSLVAKNRATLEDTARVEGRITCRGLVVTEGAWFDGTLSMGPPPDSQERN